MRKKWLGGFVAFVFSLSLSLSLSLCFQGPDPNRQRRHWMAMLGSSRRAVAALSTPMARV